MADTSLQAIITYTPSKRRRRHHDAEGGGAGAAMSDDDNRSTVSGTATATSDAGSIGDDTDPHITHVAKLEKLLTITYANGSVQTFPLLAVTTTPFVELSVPPVCCSAEGSAVGAMPGYQGSDAGRILSHGIMLPYSS